MGLRNLIITVVCGAVVVAILLADFSFFHINSKVADPTKRIGEEQLDKSLNVNKSTLLAKCEEVIKPQLDHSESFKIDMSQTRVNTHNNKLVLDIFYEAENSHGITMSNKTSCDFSQTGILISTTNLL